MKRFAHTVWIGSAVMFVLTACNMGGTPNGTEGTLEPGGSYIDDGGMVVSALPGALQERVGIAVENVDAPLQPLPASVRALTAYMAVRSDTDTFSGDNPFLLAVPVPTGANTDRLELAFLLEPEDVVSGAGLEGPTWVLLPGVYDPAGGYFLVTVALLSKAGRTTILVESDDAFSPPLNSAAGPATQQAAGEFLVSCRTFDNTDINNLGSTCSSTDEEDLEEVLEAAFADYTELGFGAPYLRRRIDGASSFTPNNPNMIFGEYLAELRPSRTATSDEDRWPCGAFGGFTNLGGYSAATQSFFVCIGTGGVTAGATDTGRHEYFHATQFGYAAVRSSRNVWVLEGTAVASVRSGTTMNRDLSRALRVVDEPLTADEPNLIEYESQDFFVFLGNRLGEGLNYLTEAFKIGASTNDIDTALRNFGLGGIEATYWEWAKNQSFEARFDHGAGELGSTCAFSPATANETVISYNHIAPPSARTFVMPPLTSAVVRINLNTLPGADYTTTLRASDISTSHPNEVRVKFYDAAEAGTTNCWSAPESDQISVTVSAGQPGTVYALISNLRRSGSAGAQLSFGPSQPSIEVRNPRSGAVFEEVDSIEFLAVASGLTGSSTAAQISWSYPRYDGVPIVFGSTNGATVRRQFCDGTYTVTAEAIDPSTSRRVSSTVTFTVQNSTPPPPLCAPNISIIAPNDGDAFTVDSAVTFQALFDDDHPETDDPIYPIIWRLGGPTGLIIHRDSASFTRDKFDAGTHVVHVQYGSASDSVTISVVDTSNTAPSATILSPSHEQFFQWQNLPFPSPTIALSGSGIDPEDGNLTGSNLQWWYLREGSSTWVYIGSGASAALPVLYGGTNITRYQVRLRATDSQGLFGEHEIQISVQNPPT